jgi:hypothetical protein
MIKLEILGKEDIVIGFSDNKLAVRKKNGEVEIFIIEMDENNLPRVNPESLLITFRKSKGNTVTIKKDNLEYETF